MSMSSSLEQRGAAVEEPDMDSPTIKEMVDNCEEVEQSTEEQRVQSSGGSASVEITEISSSSQSPSLIQQTSVATSEGDQARTNNSTSTADVTGECELMPLILDQLQSSLSSFSSPAALFELGGGGGYGGGAFNGASATLSCYNLVGSQSHHPNPSSHTSSYISHSSSSDKSSSWGNKFGNANSGTPLPEPSANPLHRSNTYNCPVVPPPISGVGSNSVDVREEESSSSTTTGTSSEECLFDSGTESGEDLSANVSGTAIGIEDLASEQPPPNESSSSPPQLPTVVTVPSVKGESSSVADFQTASQYDDATTATAAEFSCFMEGLKNSLERKSTRRKNSALGVSQYPPNSDTSFLSQDQPISGGLGLNEVELDIGCVNPAPRKFSVPNLISAEEVVGSSLKGCEENKNNCAFRSGEDYVGEEPLSTTDKNDSGLIQQVDKVLTLLRASLIKDPSCLAQLPQSVCDSDSTKGRELIALIDRLKFSLNVEESVQNQKKPVPLEVNPVGGKEDLRFGGALSGLERSQSNMIGCAIPQYLEISKSSSNPWIGDFAPIENDFIGSPLTTSTPSMEYALGNTQSNERMVEPGNILINNNNNNSVGIGMKEEQNGDGGVPWKIRLARRRSHPRSHTVGVTQEELAEARRLFEESTGFRFYARDQKQAQPQPSIYSNVQDLSTLGNLESINNNNNLNNINNYGRGCDDAALFGSVPADDQYNPRMFTNSEIEREPEPDNLPLSPTSTSLPYPHSRDEVVASQNTPSISGDNQMELVPSGGGSGCVSMSTPSWQTDVEKRLTSMPRPFVPFGKQGYQPPPERRMTYASIDDSCAMTGGVIGNLKIKPFRKYSLDNNKSSSGATTAQDDPSKSFFTPQETVQIAIHQAAIKKQMSEEEDRRKRRNSLSSYQIQDSGMKPDRLLALGMPKPYTPTQQSNGYSPFYSQSGDSGYTEESGTETGLNKEDQLSTNRYDNSMVPTATAAVSNSVVPYTTAGMTVSANSRSGMTSDIVVSSGNNTITYTTTPSGNFVQQQQQQQQQQSPKRIENVQISLKELSSSEFPQLQIAITLNTKNNSPLQENGSGSSLSGENTQNSVARLSNVANTATAISVPAQQGNINHNHASSGMAHSARAMQMEMGNSNPYFSNDEGQQASASASRAIRYKSKSEKKKRLKRANTIDIPQPPGLLLHSNNNDDDDDTGMEDEEDSDSNNYRVGKASGPNNGGGQFSKHYQPFMPKTEGDRKFLAFLEKNNAVGVARPQRPSYLGVNDRQWTSRFSNLKTSFDTSSQGSSPSASPTPSPLRPPRSVSEMALSHGKQAVSSGDSFSKPVWANSEKSQLPPQVRSKLHVFENKSFEGQDYSPQWRSPHSSSGFQAGAGSNNQFGANRGMMSGFPGMKQTVSTNALNQVRGGGYGQPSRINNRPVYSSHDNVAAVSQKRLLFQGSSFDSKLNEQRGSMMNAMRKPTPVKPHQSFPNLPTEQQQSLKGDERRQTKQPSNTAAGVHMVHATAAAMEAMKQSAFVPASVVPVPGQSSAMFPTKVGQEEKIDLPWAKRAPEVSPSFRADNSNRVQSSKARFEQPLPMTQAVPQGPPASAPQSHYQQQQQQQQIYEQGTRRVTDSQSSYPLVPTPNPPAGMQRGMGFSSVDNSSEDFVPVVRPPLKTFGVTQSFDEAFKRNLDQQISSGGSEHPDEELTHQPFPTSAGKSQFSSNSVATGSQQDLSRYDSTKKPFELQQSSGSAFASRPVQMPYNDQPNSNKAVQPEVENAPDSVAPGPEGMVLTPVTSRVMRGPQQQRATMSNRISTLQDDEQNTRMSSARSNLRNFINLFQTSSPPSTEINSADVVISPALPQTNHNLISSMPNLVPLIKSVSGDSLHVSPNSPRSIASTSPRDMSRSPLRSQPHPQAQIAAAAVPFVEQQKRPAIIPRQKSLSEFPKIASAPRIEPLRVETDIKKLAPPSRVNTGMTANITEKMQSREVVQQQQSKTIVQPQPQPQPRFQQQKLAMQINSTSTAAALQQQNKLAAALQSQQQSQQQIKQVQQLQQATPKPTRSYPDTLQRTSSGSSIFNRAKNLLFGSQDGGPPSTKLRSKLPSTSSSQTKLAFPKQFEAQMSPDSADRKQRELAAYFHQQQQQQQQEFLQQQSSVLSGGKLRKSASHSKIMHRQRSLSDGDDDVDAIFESLFKASVESKAIKSAEAVSKSEISSSSISVECEQSEMKASSSVISSSSVSGSSSVSATTKVQTVSTATATSISMQSMTRSAAALPATPINKFKAMDQQANAGKKAGAPLFKFANEGLKSSASSAKDILLYWCQCRTREYENVKIENFSSSWSDGMAFCALIHHFYPDAFDYNSLNPRNRKYNFDLAFRIADEKAGIYPLLDTEDMVAMGTRPDWKCVFTYVQSMYQKLKDM